MLNSIESDNSSKNNFFEEYSLKKRGALTKEEFKNFANLESDISRCKFIRLSLKDKNDLAITREYKGKSLDIALNFKKLGNQSFQNQNWLEALAHYNRSYISTPAENEAELSIILANRSACLHHLEEFNSSLLDIETSLKHNYPKNLKYKVLDRKARCYLGKKNNEEALKAFQLTLTSLDDANLPLEKKSKIERDVQIMIKLLQRNIELEAQQAKKQMKSTKSKLKSGVDKNTNFLSKSVFFDYNKFEGRFAKANEEIGVGDSIITEGPHCSVLLETYNMSHCQNCFKRTIAPISCPSCCDVIFCSNECRTIANSTFHKVECGLLQHIWSSGASITCIMALRIISQKSEKYFMELKDKLGSDSINTDTLPNDNYCKIFKLVTHEDVLNTEEYFQRTLMADLMSQYLKNGMFFESEDNTDFITSLIFKNIQILRYNAHEIFELQQKGKDDIGKSVFIGGGIYPTLSLFNHSCDPSIVRYFQGNRVFVRAVKNIAVNDVIGENYGPLFTQVARDERRQQLKSQYKFDCICTPCQDDWPKFEDMDTEVMRFRCDSGNDCTNVLLVPTDVNEFMIKCTECGGSTNIMKGLKALQDTDQLFRTATRLHQEGNSEKAMLKYIEMLKILHDVLVPPFRDYHLCQQGIRRCMLELGNRNVNKSK